MVEDMRDHMVVVKDIRLGEVMILFLFQGMGEDMVENPAADLFQDFVLGFEMGIEGAARYARCFDDVGNVDGIVVLRLDQCF
jgi:hypothetical protein